MVDDQGAAMSKRSRRKKNSRQRHQDVLCSQVVNLIIGRFNWTRAGYPQESSASFLERISQLFIQEKKDVL